MTTADPTNADVDSEYGPEYAGLFKAMYGPHLLSLGGLPAVDNMLSGLDLRQLLAAKGSRALDLGFGLGGTAFHLARTYKIEIAGVELQPWMVEHARAHVPPDVAHLLRFEVYDADGQIPFEAESFELAYSKGVFEHVKDKVPLFRQVSSRLKANGTFVICDWVHPAAASEASGRSTRAHETRESYERALEEAGFKEMSFRDDSKIFVPYLNALLENMEDTQALIEQEHGSEFFAGLFGQKFRLLERVERGQVFPVRISSRK